MTKDLDSLPFPARHLYLDKGQRAGHSTRGFTNMVKSTDLYISRGCPFKCTFCEINTTFDYSVRFRSPDNIVEEIEEVRDRFGIEYFTFASDTFTVNHRRTHDLVDRLLPMNLKSWDCCTRVDRLERDLLQKMKDSGCKKLSIGVETGSERVIALNRKHIQIEQVREAVALAREVGIANVEATFIVGSHPDETLEDLAKTEALIRELPLSFISVSIIVPYPGTHNYELMKERGYIYTDDWSQFVMSGRAPKWRTAHITPDELLRHQKRLNQRFYLNPAYMMRQAMNICSVKELIYYAKAATTLISWIHGVDLAAKAPNIDWDDSSFAPGATLQSAPCFDVAKRRKGLCLAFSTS